ncbi:hypothetical protein BU17DRAFT_96721 [Hysterangium stoloniferum]|nr:hypothetical protein BU17DRAFT_96721 [Hysterangium stoloniferum]
MDDIIVKFGYFRVRPSWLFVRTESSNGYVGWGEATLAGQRTHSGKACRSGRGTLEALKETFISSPTDNIDIARGAKAAWLSIKILSQGRGAYEGQLGLDIALWDLPGRRLGVSILSLLAKSWIGGDQPSDIEESVKTRRDAGYKAVKMTVTEDLGFQVIEIDEEHH